MGVVTKDARRVVLMTNALSSQSVVDRLSGEPLPWIC